ncbi:MAG: hypothetical protein J6M14_03970 [Campylobacter sp.]|nr:hypothetical protein [Campylobacter sp.]
MEQNRYDDGRNALGKFGKIFKKTAPAQIYFDYMGENILVKTSWIGGSDDNFDKVA